MNDAFGFELLYEVGACLVVAKPAGVATQAPPGIDSLEVRVRDFLRKRDDKQGNFYLALPHRLDRPVSGAVVLAKNIRAAKRLSQQFEQREVRKIYWACIAGEPAEDSGTWTDWIRKIPDAPQAEIVDQGHPDAKQAVLHFRRLGATAQGTWLEIALETGRMHQVRVQAAARGWPVLGDSLYGSTVEFGPASEDFRARAIALHGRTLSFVHPMTKEPAAVTAPLPDYWQPLGISD